MLLVVGFLAFNGGSNGSITEPGDGALVAKIMINTILGGTGGSIIILFSSKLGFIGTRTWNFKHTVNAALAGMVSCLQISSLALYQLSQHRFKQLSSNGECPSWKLIF